MSLSRLTTLTVITAVAAVVAWAQLPLTVPITNPGFENGFQGWAGAAPNQFGKFISLDHQVKHSGQASAHIASDDANMPYLATVVTGLKGGATYTFEAWYRGVKGGKGHAALKIEYYNAKRENTSGVYSKNVTANSDQWQLLKVTAPCAPDTIRASLLLRLMNIGEVWFDDASFIQTGEPPVAAVSPVRMPVLGGQKSNLKVEVRLLQPATGALHRPQVAVTDSTGKELPGVVAQLQPGPDQAFTGSVQLPALAPGDYLVKFSFPQGSATMKVFAYASHRQPRDLTDTGTLLVNGKPFFPIGLYHVGVSNYKLLADHGFNAVQGEASNDMRTFAASLKAAHEAGLMVDVPLYSGGQVKKNLAASLEKIKRYKDNPAVLDWKIIDEPDLRPKVMDQVPEAYRKIRAADPVHPILLTIANPAHYAYWTHFCDMMQVDPYPLPQHPLTMVSDAVGKAHSVLQPWQELSAVVQSGWVMGKNNQPANQPTFEQARCLVYLSIINGAKGIFWYSMHDPGWDLTKTPLWGRFKEINAETTKLGQVAINGKPIKGLSLDNKAVQAAAWNYLGRIFLIVTNPSAQAQTATLRLPQVVSKCQAADGQPSPQVVGGTVKLSLPSLACCRYLVTVK